MNKKRLSLCIIGLSVAITVCQAQETGVRLENAQYFQVNSTSGGVSKSGLYTCSFSVSQEDANYVATVHFRSPSFMNYPVNVYDQHSSVIHFGNNGLKTFSVNVPEGTYIRNIGGYSPTETNIPRNVDVWAKCMPKA